MPLPTSAAADRNKQPILDLLQQLLPDRGTALEIASGGGQHVGWFAAEMRTWTWQPTDADPHVLPTIAARSAAAGLANVRAPLLLSVTAQQWPCAARPFSESFDAIYCANMLHIAPWNCCAGLMRGSARHLALDGLLITYGPYFEESAPAAPSNDAFDASLRQRDPAWGIRRLADVTLEAGKAGLRLQARHQMPANNLLLVFGRAG
ncbi:MAG: class I SAM-dependent methyltransferase [Pseudomonadota bacterium]|nr:class I SAM-dependent methyltransferase [Pseudomonadota bacterium]